MATVEEITLKVNALEAAQSVKDLRGSMGELRKIVNETKIGSDEYKAALDGVQKAQNMLSNATKLGVTETEKAGESYNALSRKMAELKQEYHATTDAIRRKDLAKEIKDINNTLKDMDSDVGVFARNVGNYAQGVAEGFSSIGGAASGMVNPIKGVTTGFQLLSKTPVIAILGFLINLFGKAIQSMKSTEEGSQALSRAFDGFKVVADLMTKGLQLLGKGLTAVANGFTSILKKIGLMNDESEKRIGIGQKEIALEQEKRRVTMANADAELKIAKLRAESTDKINKSASERLALIKEAAELEQETYKNNYNLAKQEYELIKEKNSLLPSSSQELQAEADAYASMVQAETAYYNKQREYNSQMAEAFNQAKTNAQELKEEITSLDELLNIESVNSYEGSLAKMAEARAKWREQFLTDEAVFYEDLLGFEEEHAKDVEKLNADRVKDEENTAKKKQKIQQASLQVASNIGQLLMSVADEDTKHGKALAIAGSTIDTISGAIGAYMSAQKQGLPPWVSIPLGVTSAATVLASGMANIAQIKKTDTSGTVSMAGASVQTYAPAVVQNVPVTRTLTGASEEAKLNQILDNTSATASGTNRPVKAYVVASEMQGELLYEQQTDAETSF
ncbi:MAG: hypothetical protein II236_07925 [Alistipes sp.]|nr:hypothetical protein [Alistipes sp.]